MSTYALMRPVTIQASSGQVKAAAQVTAAVTNSHRRSLLLSGRGLKSIGVKLGKAGGAGAGEGIGGVSLGGAGAAAGGAASKELLAVRSGAVSKEAIAASLGTGTAAS